MLDILKEPGSYCLRERISREGELLRSQLRKEPATDIIFTPEFETAINIISILLKYNPNYLNHH
jgi:hypothetical protein